MPTTDTLSQVTPILDTVAGVASRLGSALPGSWGVAANVASLFIGLAADIAASSQNPVTHVTRIRDIDPQLQAMRQKWAAAKKKNGVA